MLLWTWVCIIYVLRDFSWRKQELSESQRALMREYFKCWGKWRFFLPLTSLHLLLWLPLMGPPSLGGHVLPRNSPYSDQGRVKVTSPQSHNPHFAFDPFSSLKHFACWHFTSFNSLGSKSMVCEIYYHWIPDKSFWCHKHGELATKEVAARARLNSWCSWVVMNFLIPPEAQ